mmetsp:Transcript_49273/g.107211  ORF Transcript_49273/g.107211 Transcript_49273/m.107211 type:complete len:84 (-) Transcript_49273:101-352(-)
MHLTPAADGQLCSADSFAPPANTLGRNWGSKWPSCRESRRPEDSSETPSMELAISCDSALLETAGQLSPELAAAHMAIKWASK